MQRRIRALNLSSAWGGGHVQTCINLLKGMRGAGGEVHLDLIRARTDMGEVPFRTTFRGPLARYGLRRFEPMLRAPTERRFLAGLRQDDIAWLWPTVSLATYREVHRRGNPIVMEGINCRIASARRDLDAAYAAEGLVDPDRLEDARIAEEEEMLSMASHIFAPNAHVEAALKEADTRFAGRILPASYGAWMAKARPRSSRSGDQPLTVLFVGRVSLPKGAHLLLRAWAKAAPKRARLRFCGRISPVVAELCADELNRDDVETPGFVRDIGEMYRTADVFVMPSLSEGGPQVIYEAAAYGLALLASPMGSGRLGQWSDAILPFDPYDVDGFADALHRVLTDEGLLSELSARTRRAAPRYDWSDVGQSRLESLRDL